jgi:2-iminobutanoate/2-iminopropanoate deaminase
LASDHFLDRLRQRARVRLTPQRDQRCLAARRSALIARAVTWLGTPFHRGVAAIFDPCFAQARRVAGAVALAVAGTTSPAFAQSTDRSPNMPENIRFSNPDTMQKPPGYSHVAGVTGPGRTVYFAGQGIDKSSKMGANAREQMEIAFENVNAALASVGTSFENVVINNYIIDIGTNIAHYREVRDRYVNTAIGVPQLARPGALFEVEAIAVLAPK